MGKELLEDNLVFSETIGDLDDVLMSLEHAPSWTLREALLEPPNSSLVSQAEYSQPLCTAVQIALVKLLTSWGLNATAVVGHSSGEIAAAYAAGLLSEAQAITIAYYRGYAVSQCKTNGQMVAAGIFVDESHEIISSLDLQEDVVVACVNSPESVTISGALDGVGKVVAELSVRNKFAKVVQTGGRAYHSPSMLDIGSEYERLMSNALAVMPRPKSMPKNAPVVQFFCRVGKHGETLDQFDRSNTFYLKPQYWRRNLESPVQFKQAVTNLAQSLPYHMVEIGPHPAMSGAVKNIKSSLEKMGPNTAYCTTLSRGRDASSCMKALAGSLFFAGYDLDFMAVNSITSSAASLSVIHDLPPYKWTYDDLLWSESRSSIEMRNRPFVRHELLGAPILTGNGVESVWRNQFKLEEVPWIADHKLESQIVFPGAGYLAMAIEAITRLKKDEIDLGSRPKISFREVSISAALVLEETDNDLEMFTTIAPTKLTRSSASDRWYDFTISSVKGQRTNSHCSGSICIEKVAEITPSVRVDDSNFDEFNMKPWYEKLATEGLDFGPHFQTIKSLRTDKDRVIPNAVSTTPMVEYVARPESKTGAGAIFVMHPLVIDALLQAATFGATAGKLTSLRAHLPIFIGSMELRPPTMSQINQIARIDTQSHTTGFTPKSISASLSVDQDILINMNGVRLSEYTGKSIAGHAEDKNPCLRVVWKPDITRFDTKNIAALDGYIKSFLESHSKFEDSLLVGRVGAVLDLAEHKNARLNVFELDTYHNNRTEDWLEILGSQTGFPLSKSWSVGSFDQSGVSQKIAVDKPGIFEQLTPEDKFDVILAVKPSKSMVDYSSLIDSLSPQGMIITKTSMVSNHPVTQQEIQILNLSCGLSLITRLPDYRSLDGQHILIIRANGSPANDEIELGLLAAAPHIPGLASVRALPLSEVGDRDVTNNTVVISLLETSMEFLATMTPEGKEHLCRVTNNAKDLIWMTSASTIDGTNSDVQLANGLSRALMLEQPATRFVILDIGQLEKLNASAKAGMVHVVGKILINNDTPDDKEFVLRDGVLHVSRFIADVVLNARFEQRLQKQPRKIKLADVYPARLRIQKIGMMDTIYFQQEDISLSSVASGYLEVDVKAVSPNAKDIYVLSGKVDTQKGTSSSPA
jgi:acyl transferase domain-containing protein